MKCQTTGRGFVQCFGDRYDDYDTKPLYNNTRYIEMVSSELMFTAVGYRRWSWITVALLLISN
jgi:hypothetical protein